MKLHLAQTIAEHLKRQLEPHCHRIEIAGSIRRKKPDVKDIEIVAIPKPYETGLFENGIAPVVNQWEKVKGELPCKYTQRIIKVRTVVEDHENDPFEDQIKLDLFFAVRENWGLIYAIRTGSAEYSHRVLAAGWKARGYTSKNGMLRQGFKTYPVYEEIDLFERIGIPWIKPELRNL